MDRADLLSALDSETNCVFLEFEKKDGTRRYMSATRSPKQIPEEFAPKSERPLSNPDVIRVFDIEAQGWRSFDFSRLYTYRIVPLVAGYMHDYDRTNS